MIKINNVTKKYGSFKAVDNLNLNIKKGEILGFLGPNGAGKSTTMKMITGFVTPNEGDIFINNNSVNDHSLKTRSHIGYLPENNPLYYELKVEEFLDFVADLKKVAKKDKSKRLDYVIEHCGLSDKRDKLISTLSKGYKQRVGLAQALIADPDILILDEPTIGLDPNQVIEIRELIREISKNKTIIFCSHILSEVEAICSRIVIIDKGQIKIDGSIEDLTASSKGYSLLELTIGKESKKIDTMIDEFGEIKSKLKNFKGTTYIINVEIDKTKKFKEELLSELIHSKIELFALKDKTTSLEDVFINTTN